MKSNRKKDLIDYMAEQLRDHSLPYKEGAWEHFAQKHGGKKPLGKQKPTGFWPYVTSIAAVLLLGVGLFLWQDKTQPDDMYVYKPSLNNENQTESTHSKQGNEMRPEDVVETENVGERAKVSVDGETVNELASNGKAVNKKSTAKEMVKPSAENANNYTEQQNNGELLATNDLFEDDLTAKKDQLHTAILEKEQELAAVAERANTVVAELQNDVAQKDVIESMAEEKTAIEMLLEKEPIDEQRAMASVKKMEKSKKWDFGVAISPSMVEEKINMGGGLTIAYQLTDKLSLGSGLSVVDLNVSSNQVGGGNNEIALVESIMEKSDSRTMAVAGNKQLTSISTNVLGLDIPIDFRYRLAKNFYLGAGASLFTVLSENRANNYVSQMDNSRMVVAQGLANNSTPEVKTVRTSEATAETPLEDGGYSTFLNFSVGQRIPLSSRIGLSVEPFYKLPVGKITTQNMNFNYGGIRIITSF